MIVNIEKAIEKLYSLPRGKIFSNAKDISNIFKKSNIPYSKVLFNYEQGEQNANIKFVDIDKIEVTQPNITSSKVEKYIKDFNQNSAIPGVMYGKNIVIPDGHHRLTAAYLLGYDKIKVSLVQTFLKEYKSYFKENALLYKSKHL